MLLRRIIHFLCFFLFFQFLTITSHSQSFSSSYSDCAPLSYPCASVNFTISYPFQVYGRPDYCGHPDYLLNCINDSLIIYTSSNDFYPFLQVTSIDYLNSQLNLVEFELRQSTCPQPFSNRTINTTLLQYSEGDRNFTLYIDCNQTSLMIPGLADFGCLTDTTGRRSYFKPDNGSADNLLVGCSRTVVVTLGKEAAEDLVSGNLGLGQALQRGFLVKWTAGKDWCSHCVSSGGYCGYNNRTRVRNNVCFCPNGMIVGSCYSSGQIQIPGKSDGRRKFIIGICVGLASFLIGSVLFVLWFRSSKTMSELFCQKKNSRHAQTIEVFLEKYDSLATKRYTYSDIKKMTKSFSEKLGQGGYGSVYKGKLFDGHLVAVKILSETKGNGEDFINEVAAIGNTSHVNVVSLRGFCVEEPKRALIYDYMPNGSLDKYIYSKEPEKEALLGWEKLYEIAMGIARGLEYLHRGCSTRIVHFDIKPHNILLDHDFCPKISDFGMAKLCPPKQSIISVCGARGTIGYIAPEVFSRTFGAVSSKSDVYSYGMLLLDMFGRKSKVRARSESASDAYFPQYIYRHLENDKDDLDLAEYGVTDDNEEIARKMMMVGFWCIQTMPENRPTTSRMVEMLEGNINDLPIPPKPLLSSPLDLIADICTSSGS